MQWPCPIFHRLLCSELRCRACPAVHSCLTGGGGLCADKLRAKQAELTAARSEARQLENNLLKKV